MSGHISKSKRVLIGRTITQSPDTQGLSTGVDITGSVGSHSTHLRGAVGKTKRIKWTRDMNLDIMRTFYRINRCDDTPLPGYRHVLHREFVKIYPDLNLTEQNVVDRRSVILKKGYLTTQELGKIRMEIGNELQLQEIHAIESPIQTGSVMNVSSIISDSTITTAQNQESYNNIDEELSAKFYSLIELYNNTNLNTRPHIPKLRFGKETDKYIFELNKILENYLLTPRDLYEVHLAIYCAAVTVIETSGQQTFHKNSTAKQEKRTYIPAWRRRLEDKINYFRAQVDIISQYLQHNHTRKILNKVKQISKSKGIKLSDSDSYQKLLNLKDTLRQKMKLKGARLRRYNELTKRKEQNTQFINRRKDFFRNLNDSPKILPTPSL